MNGSESGQEERIQTMQLNAKDLAQSTGHGVVGGAHRAKSKWWSQRVTAARSSQQLQGWRDKESRWLGKNRGHQRGAGWGKLGPWRSHSYCQKYWPEQGRKGGRLWLLPWQTLASPRLPYHPLPAAAGDSGQTDQSQLAKKAGWCVFCRNQPSVLQTEQGKQRKGGDQRANRQTITTLIGQNETNSELFSTWNYK